ncbi:MAG TPA: cytochrome c oxidase subunit II [Candidatus Thermoplasmatota archaeon]|nr:cytochrome c oxidase subunit II [Candidatus Thermoplasmatota archaeon]
MRVGFRIVLTTALVAGALIVPSMIAAPKLFPDAHSELQRRWQSLFTEIFWAALLVFVLVEGLIIYALIRFARKPDGPQEGPHIHGNTKMEIAWTIAPTVVMAWLLVVSLQGLEFTDNDVEPEFWVEVYGSQFQWEFKYPPDYQNGTLNQLYIEEDRRVGLKLFGNDVIHAFNVPEAGVMIDAVPGKQNTFWMEVDDPGNYTIQCRELCGIGHGKMRATLNVFAAGSQERPWGPVPTAEPVPDANATAPGPLPSADLTPEVKLADFSITPSTFAASPGQTLLLKVRNDGAQAHNLFIGNHATKEAVNQTRDLRTGETEDLFVQLPAQPAVFDWWCNVPGHDGLGMLGTLSTGGQRAAGGGPLLPGPGPVAAGLAVLGVAVVLQRRLRAA